MHSFSTRLTVLTGCLLVVSALSGAAANPDKGDFDGKGWLSGGEGLIEALQKVEKDKKPLVLYFYADWCGYCRQFEKALLGTRQVKSFLSTGYAVMINPDSGAQENGIAQYYRVMGYPAFFVYGQKSGKMIRVDRHRMVGGRPQLLSPEEFIQAIKEASSR
jgi:thiol:disulfide interchange protein